MTTSAVREMTLLHTRELVRDKRQFYFVLIFPFLIMAMFLLIAEVFPDTSEGTRQMVIPMALFLSVTSIAFLATAAPVATMRQETVLLIAGLALDLIEPNALPALFGLALLGLGMFGALGYLLGGVLPGPESASNLGTLIQLSVFFLSGLVFPLELLPDMLESVLLYAPTTFFADLMVAQLPAGDPVHPAGLSVVVVLATTLVLAVLAVRTFKWDQGENG